ncbi:MAG: (Fe-S)-binding protein [Armatimonadetes bacterium]|nr:(Fe-S)-binding protein [Armatimonadota bacterium]
MAVTEPDVPLLRVEDHVPGLRYEDLLECVHCGICLSVCPTFDLLDAEADSPRGRLYYMRALAEGRIELAPNIVRHLDSCLGCRACETACPSAVHYGEMLAQVRNHIEANYSRAPRRRLARRLLLNLLTRPHLLALALAPTRLPAIRGLVRRMARALFGDCAPDVPDGARLWPASLPQVTPAQGERRARVGFLAGCVMPVLFPRVNEATVRVLAANGCEVVVPRGQGCCGALAVHQGYLEDARAQARRLIRAFEGLGLDAVVTNSAGCGSGIKEYPHLFPTDDPWRPRAEALAARTQDVSEFLAALGPRPPGQAIPLRVTYHDACHLAHGQGVRAQPRELLRLIPGLELVECPQSDWCCGSAGVYNFLEPDLARQLQQRKVENILTVRPAVVVTGNPGCHAWISAGMTGHQGAPRVRHTMELLAEAYGARNSGE